MAEADAAADSEAGADAAADSDGAADGAVVAAEEQAATRMAVTAPRARYRKTDRSVRTHHSPATSVGGTFDSRRGLSLGRRLLRGAAVRVGAIYEGRPFGLRLDLHLTPSRVSASR
jgi:hypothetical protein